MSNELSHDDLTAIAAFIKALNEATIDTGVVLNREYLWIDGEVVGRVEPADSGGYWFKAAS